MIFVFGVNHKTAALDIRERVSFSQHELSRALISLCGYPLIQGSVILSTCNRVEIYVSSSSMACLDSVEEFLCDFHRLKINPEPYSYTYKNEDAVRHIFRVVSSLDSMVIGEDQIFGQVREAYLSARSCESVDSSLSLLFEETIKVGKKIRVETQIGKGAVSVSTAAIKLAKEAMKSLKDKEVLIIGAGKIGEITVKNLASKGIKTICVANRTYQKAVKLAEVFGGRAVRFDALDELLEKIDIVISSTSAPHFIIKKDIVSRVMSRRESPLFFIDLGVPRNIEADVSLIENVYLYDIDDLTNVKDKNLEKRYQEVEKAVKIIDSAVDSFASKFAPARCMARRT